MRRFAVIAVLAGVVSSMSGCDVPTKSGGPIMLVSLMEYDTLADVSAEIDLSTLTAVDYNGGRAVKLQDLVTISMIPEYDNKTPGDATDDVDRRQLYGYRLIGSDGFSAHLSRGGDDLGWSAMLLGYLYLDTRDAAFDASLNLAGMYKTRDVEKIEIYREIDIVLPDTSWRAVIAEAQHTTVDTKCVVMLTGFVAGVLSPETYQYNLTGVDGYNKALTWAELQTAYFELSADLVGYTVEMAGAYKVRNLASITVSTAQGT